MDHNLLNRLEFLNSLPKYTRDNMIKGLYPNNISSEKLTVDKIILLRTYDKYDRITKADYYVIIYFLLENIFKLKKCDKSVLEELVLKLLDLYFNLR